MAEEKKAKQKYYGPADKRTIDPASEAVIANRCDDGFIDLFARSDAMYPRCKFGSEGVCCRVCAMGPCRVQPDKPGKDRGVCGANVDTIVARNFIRMVAAGAAAHSDHGRAVCETLLAVAKGHSKDYEIKDEQKAIKVALDMGIEVGDRPIVDIVKDIAELALAQYGQQQGEVLYTKKAPLKLQEKWRELGVIPRGIDREIVEILHRTHMGVDHDYEHLLLQGARAALGDGWGGSMIATELQDILFGTPEPITCDCNLGVLEEDKVNIIVHGHEPLLSEMIVAAASSEDMLKEAEKVGAKGISLSGICCTANEILMRHGVPPAGNFLQQEHAIMTGAVDAMIVDVQCIMPSLPEVARCYNTKVISTSPLAKFPGAEHIQFDEDDALNIAKKIVKKAIENFPNRPDKVFIPDEKEQFIGGFSHETINYLLGGTFRASYRPLNDNIINGKIRGVAGVVGCNNPKDTHDWGHTEMIKELLKNDVLVLVTGCTAIAVAKQGLCRPEAAAKYCGPGLAEVCETVGIPPVLHMGSCVDNSRILIAATAMVKEGGLGDDICDLPAAGAAPEWMSEKAISIGQYFVSSGVYTMFCTTFPFTGSKNVMEELTVGMEKKYGGMWDFEMDPVIAAQKMIQHIDKKRKALGIDKARERVLFDMEKRREMA